MPDIRSDVTGSTTSPLGSRDFIASSCRGDFVGGRLSLFLSAHPTSPQSHPLDVTLEGLVELDGPSEAPGAEPLEETGRRPFGEIQDGILEEGLERMVRTPYGPFGHRMAHSDALPGSPSSRRPTVARLRQGCRERLVEGLGFLQTSPDPLENGDADGVPDEFPAETLSPSTQIRGRFRPAGGETLQAFAVANVGYDYPVEFSQPDGRLRRNADGGSTLERGDAVHGPPEASEPLGPVEAAGDSAVVDRLGRAGVVDEEDGPGILGGGRQEDDTASTLREPPRTCVDHAISPVEAELDQPIREVVHGVTTFELQHERNVLDEEPLRASAGRDETQQLVDEAGLCTADTGRPPRLAQILAREAAGHEIHAGRKTANVTDVVHELDVGEVGPEDGLGMGLYLAEEFRLVALSVQADFYATDASEEASD